MLSVLLDVRRARQRRLSLVSLAVCALALPFFASALPHVAPILAPPTTTTVLLAAASVVASSGAAAWAGREAHWTLADDIAWTLSLTALAILSALGTAPITLAALLYGAAAIALAVRVPPSRLVLVAGLTAPLGPLVRLLTNAPVSALQSSILTSALVLLAHVTVARATHALAYVLAERESLLADRRVQQRSKEPTRVYEAEATTSRSAGTSRLPRVRAEESSSHRSSDEVGWEGLVERVRSALASLCEPAGVVASVHAEVRGLAPPNSRMRQNVLKIAQEAAGHALRDSAPRTIAVTLRRGDGGLLLEVLDDGSMGEGTRSRRTLPSLRGRVAPLGGSAELRRADAGWMVRVRLPCEQLN
jgi:hypothetical protein